MEKNESWVLSGNSSLRKQVSAKKKMRSRQWSEFIWKWNVRTDKKCWEQILRVDSHEKDWRTDWHKNNQKQRASDNLRGLVGNTVETQRWSILGRAGGVKRKNFPSGQLVILNLCPILVRRNGGRMRIWCVIKDGRKMCQIKLTTAHSDVLCSDELISPCRSV